MRKRKTLDDAFDPSETILVGIRRDQSGEHYIGTKLNGFNTLTDPSLYEEVGSYKGQKLYERRREYR